MRRASARVPRLFQVPAARDVDAFALGLRLIQANRAETQAVRYGLMLQAMPEAATVARKLGAGGAELHRAVVVVAGLRVHVGGAVAIFVVIDWDATVLGAAVWTLGGCCFRSKHR
jgi:hypothetical protein